MAYVKHGTGPNDWKKGNRTKGADRKNKKGNPNPENAAALAGANADKAEMIAHYKEVAAQIAKVTKYGQEYALTLKDRLEEYIEEQELQHKPLTVAGMIRASGLSRDTYDRYRDGEADHMLYAFMDANGISYEHEDELLTLPDGREVLLVRLGTLIKQAELYIQEQREAACSSNRGNPAGNIFLLKAQQGFRDQPEDSRTTNNNTLILNNVASLSEAKDALNLLTQ